MAAFRLPHRIMEAVDPEVRENLFAVEKLFAASASGGDNPSTTTGTFGWFAPTLGNSWVNYGSGLTPAGYLLDPFGNVHIRGALKDGTLGSAAFTLPAALRPGNELIFPAYCHTGSANAIGAVAVLANGTVVPVGDNNHQHHIGCMFKPGQ